MLLAIIKSRYEAQIKPRTQNKKTKKKNRRSSVPPNLRIFKSNLLSETGFIFFEVSSNSWVVFTTINERWRFPIVEWFF